MTKKRWFIVLLVFVMMLAMSFGYIYIQYDSLRKDRDIFVKKINKETEIGIKKSSKVNSLVEKDVNKITGKDSARIKSNIKEIRKYLKPCFDFKTGKEYDKARNDVISRIGKDNDFIKKIMPDGHVGNSGGSSHMVESQNLHLSLRQFDVYPKTVKGDDYIYVVVLKYIPYNDKKVLQYAGKLKHKELLCEVSVGKDGKMNTLRAFYTQEDGA